MGERGEVSIFRFLGPCGKEGEKGKGKKEGKKEGKKREPVQNLRILRHFQRILRHCL